MLKRILLSAVCMLVLPIFFSLHTSQPVKVASPFGGIAMAGRNAANGTYCTCGCPSCICDAGEVISECSGGNSMRAVSDDDPGTPSDSTASTSDLDLGSGALILAIGLMLFARFRV
jgi:hypothetical protein